MQMLLLLISLLITGHLVSLCLLVCRRRNDIHATTLLLLAFAIYCAFVSSLFRYYFSVPPAWQQWCWWFGGSLFHSPSHLLPAAHSTAALLFRRTSSSSTDFATLKISMKYFFFFFILPFGLCLSLFLSGVAARLLSFSHTRCVGEHAKKPHTHAHTALVCVRTHTYRTHTISHATRAPRTHTHTHLQESACARTCSLVLAQTRAHAGTTTHTRLPVLLLRLPFRCRQVAMGHTKGARTLRGRGKTRSELTDSSYFFRIYCCP